MSTFHMSLNFIEGISTLSIFYIFKVFKYEKIDIRCFMSYLLLLRYSVRI